MNKKLRQAYICSVLGAGAGLCMCSIKFCSIALSCLIAIILSIHQMFLVNFYENCEL